ncbi:hypothetical protein GH714_040003 [Hevea brasiliensis]|uniref:Leucine-rich repeat-containing N-terminal plant-type domain-containing protein n=1 Tax=Hevea brasiliensis TaxID=3981 RepID=A0A6A6MRA4_HEVBR|nr:hypothetical protein GH714_040003 [Hevea brasiliensis]
MMSSFFLFFLLVDPVSGFNLGVGDGQIQCIGSERQALLNFKQGLIDDYGHLSSWGSEEAKRDCCKWRGIQCSFQTGHVTMLDLHVSELGDSNKPLRGKINHSLLELQHLNYLDLSCNDFQGTLLPNFNGSLSKLRYLNFSNVGFTGTLSYQLRNLSSLHSLDLSYNNFTKVENLEWLSHLSYLETLDLSGNSLGKVSDWVHIVKNHPYLTNLHLRSCDLATIIPPSNSRANSPISLSVLDLSSNNLSSSVFQWVFSLNSSLVHVNLSYNQLEGTIPSFFGNFCRLHTLDLAGNNLTGSLPVFLEHLSVCAESSLEILRLGMNQLHGSLPDFTRFSSLKELFVYGNQLNGSFPETFSQLSGLVVLDVAGNQLTGSLPDLTMFPSLKKLCIFGIGFMVVWDLDLALAFGDFWAF